jgi:exodeoxyribonuclease VII small subunit
MSETVQETSFEAAVSRLEEIVAAMETGQLTLDESLKAFEQAVSLSRACAAKLEHAEKRIRVLTDDGALEVPANYESFRLPGEE